MIRYKTDVNVIAMLRDAGFTTYRIAKEKLLGQRTLQKLRNGALPSWHELDIICRLCNCRPWDIIEYIDKSAGE